MKAIKLSLIICLPLLCISFKGFSQTSEHFKKFITLTLFYVDNSEGFDSDPLNSALDLGVKDQLKQKLNAANSMPDNYFFMLACNGGEPTQHSDLPSLLQSESLRKYLGRSSREAEYAVEKQAVRESFSQYPILVKKSAEIYLFLSGFALSQMTKKIDELPTPLLLPKEIESYLNNKEVLVKVHLYTNTATLDKLTETKVKSYFTFCNTELNLSNIEFDILPF